MKNLNVDELRNNKVGDFLIDMILTGATDAEIMDTVNYILEDLKKNYQMGKLDEVKTRYLYRSIVDSMITMSPEYMNNLYNAFPDNIRNQYSFMTNSMKRI